MELKYMISADFGQTFDYTAVAVSRRRLAPVGEPYHHATTWADYPNGPLKRSLEARQNVEQHYDLIRLDRVPLRTSYTTTAKGIVKLLQELYRLHTEEADYIVTQRVSVGLAIDEGGVGKAVRDILIKEMMEGLEKNKPKVHFLPVTVHGGANTTRSQGFYHVPKRDLISAGLVCYQNGKLRVDNLRYRDVLEEELKNYRLKQNLATGHTAFEPLREG